MILDVDGEVSLGRGHGQPLRHRPAREHAGALEPQVVMQPPRSVALYDEAGSLSSTTVLERLGRPLRVALTAVVVECHGASSRIGRRLNTFDTDAAFRLQKARNPGGG